MRTKVVVVDPYKMGGHSANRIPGSPMEALQQAAPHQEPAESWLEKHADQSIVKDAIDHALDDRERWVIESHYWRRMGYRLIGRELSLSHTHVMRIHHVALKKIRDYIEANPGGST